MSQRAKCALVQTKRLCTRPLQGGGKSGGTPESMTLESLEKQDHPRKKPTGTKHHRREGINKSHTSLCYSHIVHNPGISNDSDYKNKYPRGWKPDKVTRSIGNEVKETSF